MLTSAVASPLAVTSTSPFKCATRRLHQAGEYAGWRCALLPRLQMHWPPDAAGHKCWPPIPSVLIRGLADVRLVFHMRFKTPGIGRGSFAAALSGEGKTTRNSLAPGCRRLHSQRAKCETCYSRSGLWNYSKTLRSMHPIPRRPAPTFCFLRVSGRMFIVVAIFPARGFNPLQLRLIVAIERVGNEFVSQ